MKTNTLTILASIALFLWAIVLIFKKKTISMNNPLNIEYNPKNNWQGAIRPHNGKRFESFQSYAYGIRAAIILLKNYHKQGFNTVEKIITRFAPPSENNTDNYINFVSSQLSIEKNKVLDLNNDNILFPMLKAMAKMESNFNLTKPLYYESKSIV